MRCVATNQPPPNPGSVTAVENLVKSSLSSNHHDKNIYNNIVSGWAEYQTFCTCRTGDTADSDIAYATASSREKFSL